MSKRRNKKNKKAKTLPAATSEVPSSVADESRPKPGLVVRESFSGPLPPPEYLARYDQTCPGAADRIIKMAEDQSTHRQRQEAFNLKGYYAENKRGQILVSVVALVAIVLSYWLAQTNIFVGGGAIAATIAAFILSQSKIVRSVINFFRRPRK